MRAPRLRGARLAVAGAIAAVVLGIGTTLIVAGTGAYRGPGPAVPGAPGARCSAPSLPGQVVDVTVTDMGRGMMGGPTGGPGWYGMGMMRLFAQPSTVPAGTVSLRVLNAGFRTHEVVLLPLPAGQNAGQRVPGSDGRIDEAGSLGEASRSCGAGAGDGIAPGAEAWTTVRLQPGRYELVCNLPGHYAAGMFGELDVTR